MNSHSPSFSASAVFLCPTNFVSAFSLSKRFSASAGVFFVQIFLFLLFLCPTVFYPVSAVFLCPAGFSVFAVSLYPTGFSVFAVSLCPPPSVSQW